MCCTGTAAVTTGSVVARPSFAPDGAHASHSHRQYDYGGRRGAREVRERALGVMLTWRGQAWAPSPTRISCRRTPRWCAPTSTPTDVTRPATRPGSLLGRPSINRWAPADQRTENTASQPPDAPSQDRSGVLHRNCSRHDRFGSRTAQLRARWSSCFAQPSAVRLRWTQRCARGAGASSGCYVDVARASMGAVSDTDKLPPNAPMVRTDQHAHGRDSTRHASGIFARTPEHQSVGASGSAD